MDFRILSGRKKEVAAVAVASDEVVERDTYTLSDTATDVLTSPALLKIKAAATAGNIKVTLAGDSKTLLTMASGDVNEANVHVVKVWATGTALATTDFYLWQ